MIIEQQLRLLPSEAASEESIKACLLREKGIDPQQVNALRVLRKGIDARHRQVFVNLTVRAYVNEEPEETLYEPIAYRSLPDKAPVAIVVGAGPCGLFAALHLIELGVRPIVIERGKDVHSRRKDVAAISREHLVDPESNACFGEGGAGAFSDGKLFTRSKKRGSVEKILRVLCQHGASEAILSDVHPHVGTDKLPQVVERIRETIIRCGGEVRFETKMTKLLIEDQLVTGIECSHHASTSTLLGPVLLCTGHSARDVYRQLYADGVEMETKGIAVGVRLEHPAETIDRIQYHRPEGKGTDLPTAEYSFVANIAGRGVYSFCMCPGGTVVPIATGPEQVAVNGMSASLRNSPWSNSGMVVEIRPEDLPRLSSNSSDVLSNSANGEDNHLLAMMTLQEGMERTAWLAGGRTQAAPAQRMADFVNRRVSGSLPMSSYAPGLVSSPLHFLLPEFVAKRLREGFLRFGKSAHGFLTNEAVMIGVETRTSSPLRIVRQGDTLQHIRLGGLFPAGEGAGYAGGIVSAAIDGERCAEALFHFLQAR